MKFKSFLREGVRHLFGFGYESAKSHMGATPGQATDISRRRDRAWLELDFIHAPLDPIDHVVSYLKHWKSPWMHMSSLYTISI